VLEQFQASSDAVLFTSENPSETLKRCHASHIVQVGVATDKNSYIERLECIDSVINVSGSSITVLMMKDEFLFIKEALAEFQLNRNSALQNLVEGPLHPALESAFFQMRSDAKPGTEVHAASQNLYRSLLDYYCTRFRSVGREKFVPSVVKAMNDVAFQTGLDELPLMSENFATSFGIVDPLALRTKTQWTPGQTFDVGKNAKRSHSEQSFSLVLP